MREWHIDHRVNKRCRRVYEPESEDEVVRLVRKALAEGWRLRVLGSGISPNGLALSPTCMISMAQMDKVLSVDPKTKQVRFLMLYNEFL
jgi:L-galactono-1,4-lactone dehydrogenase